jgi:AcrR family transcriptional regulator
MASGKITVKKRRSPISRAEGERRLIDAAITLVRQRPFSEVGVRDIAALADVNHGFVHTWFGSKNDLLLRVVRQILEAMAQQAASAAPGTTALNPTEPDVQLAVRLLIWLNLEGVDTQQLFSSLVVLDVLEKRYLEIEGISATDARSAANMAAAIGITIASFSDILGGDQKVDTIDMLILWRHIVGLLAKHPRA